MTIADAKAFIQQLMRDPDLYEDLQGRHELDVSADSDEEAIRDEMARLVPAMGEEHGYEFTAKEGFEAVDELKNAMESEELSDLELERVAGGKSDLEKDLALSLGSIGMGCAIESAESVSKHEAERCMDDFPG